MKKLSLLTFFLCFNSFAANYEVSVVEVVNFPIEVTYKAGSEEFNIESTFSTTIENDHFESVDGSYDRMFGTFKLSDHSKESIKAKYCQNSHFASEIKIDHAAGKIEKGQVSILKRNESEAKTSVVRVFAKNVYPRTTQSSGDYVLCK